MESVKYQKLIEKIMRVVNTRPILALKDGMLAILPLTVIGSIFLIIGAIPFEPVSNALAATLGPDWSVPFMQVYAGTFGIMGMVSCFAIGHAYAKNSGVEPLPAGVLSLASYFILLRSHFKMENGAVLDTVMEKAWFGSQGMIGAIIVGIVVGAIYTALIRRNFIIKMPEQVPDMIQKQFAAMVPAFVIFVLSMAVYIISAQLTGGGTFIEGIYSLVQMPLQGLTASLPGAIGIAFFISLLWFFGVHGQSVVNGVVTALLLSNLSVNQGLAAAGQLSLANGANIVTQQFLDTFLIMSGSGITFGLAIAMLFAAKSEQYKAIGKVAIVPTLFNINEPIVFGLPIVLNPLFAIPFLLVPMIAAVMVYFAIASGWMLPFAGVTLPWSTPLILSGLFVGGWKGALLQVLILAMSTIVYFPFFKAQDRITYQKEQGIMVGEVNETH